MLLDYFDAREAVEFGTDGARFLMERIPVASGTIAAAEVSDRKKTAESLRKLYARAEVFRLGHKLNVYKKAKLANAFKWTLLDNAYDRKFVDSVTRELLLHL